MNMPQKSTGASIDTMDYLFKIFDIYASNLLHKQGRIELNCYSLEKHPIRKKRFLLNKMFQQNAFSLLFHFKLLYA